mmetsp:Transcript_39444/g.71065  ORF Transcript_39444/g.71065 Transcript_39444/m.71065 type:complete len:979 (+) Transcript_39444:97-3033(+)
MSIWRFWAILLPLAASARKSLPSRGVLMLQSRTTTARGQGQTSWRWLSNEAGNCLAAPKDASDGTWPSMEPCDVVEEQKWIHSPSGLVMHRSGKCLDASQRSIDGGVVHLWACDANLENQIWDYDAGLLKNRFGICFDAPRPEEAGSEVHMWSCDQELENQHWTFASPGSGETTVHLVGAATTNDTSTTLTMTTGPSSTTSTTTTPMLAIRNCYLDALVEGVGCSQLEVHEGADFDLNELGHETTGRQHCLQKLRAFAAGDAFVHSKGRCEIWKCGTLARLKNSAGPGGGLSANPDAVAIQGSLGKFLSFDDGTFHASEESFVPEALFMLKRLDGDGSKVTLQAPNGKLVKAEPSGAMWAVTADDARDTWEEFDMEVHGDKVALRSFHNRYVRIGADGSVRADAESVNNFSELLILNRSKAAAEGETPEALIERKQFQKEQRTSVFSNFCSYQPGHGGLHGEELRSPVFVKLFEWNFKDIAIECEEYLGPNGIDAVQISPVTEHILGPQWWTKYQPVSMGLNSRSGTEEELKSMIQRCKAVGVGVIVDTLMNHVARPCEAAKGKGKGMPCRGWGGSKFGSRRAEGARSWDAATPEMFHHPADELDSPICNVGPETGWLCPDDDCTPCDMYELPDWNTELEEVQEMHAKHLEELFEIGITMLRVDAAIYHNVPELANMLNVVPWDLVYQEWWGEYPPEDRTEYVGIYRDVAYRWKVVNALAGKDEVDFPDLLKLDGGVFGISEDMAIYPFAYHDGRSKHADPEIATYKNGFAYHQQQKFFLAWPHGVSVLIWGGYGWRDMAQGPPGCENNGPDDCSPSPVFDDLQPQCMGTPVSSPLLEADAYRGWVCEHRWQGVAGMVNFRKACRGLPRTATWIPGNDGVELGQVAVRLGEGCFLAVVRGHTGENQTENSRGDWSLNGLEIGLPEGRYCDLSSLETQRAWSRQSCPREVSVGPNGAVLQGAVPEGEVLAIHSGARLVQ